MRGEVPSASNSNDFLTSSWRLSCDVSTEIRVEKTSVEIWLKILKRNVKNVRCKQDVTNRSSLTY
jgi:hypothetical protein